MFKTKQGGMEASFLLCRLQASVLSTNTSLSGRDQGRRHGTMFYMHVRALTRPTNIADTLSTTHGLCPQCFMCLNSPKLTSPCGRGGIEERVTENTGYSHLQSAGQRQHLWPQLSAWSLPYMMAVSRMVGLA